MDLSALNTGPELDALIAEKVMGLRPGVDFGTWPEHDWKRQDDGSIDEFGYDGDMHNGPACQRCGYCYCMFCQDEATEPCRKEPQAYSENLLLAWKIINHFREQPLSVRQAFERALFDANPEREWRSLIWHVTPFAICRAALEAVREN